MTDVAYVIEITVSWLKLGIEALSALFVLAGVVAFFATVLQLPRTSAREVHRRSRLHLSQFLLLALEFQLAADILGTAVAPGWDRLIRLGAIAVIRTWLSFFVSREIREIEAEQARTAGDR